MNPTQAYQQYMRLRGSSEGSVANRRRLLTRTEAVVGDLLTASPEDFATWYADLSHRVAPSTRHSELSGLRGFYRWATIHGLVEADPTARLPLPRLPQRLPRPIHEDDLALAIGTADDRVRAMLLLAAYCGLRACEIARLRPEDVSPSPTGAVVVVRHGKGDKMRVVPAHPLVTAALSRLPVVGGWYFPRRDGRPGSRPAHLVSRDANDHLHTLGISDTLHSLRHRYGSQLYQASRDLRMVQSVLGHVSPVTTAGYAAWDQPSARAAVAALPVAA